MGAPDSPLQGKRIHITGIVQGVGFRPFIYGLAQRHALSGWVCNTSSGVHIEVTGPAANLDAFLSEIPLEAPPLSDIEDCICSDIPVANYDGFQIRDSVGAPDEFLPVSADVATCEACRRELLDPADRRFRYPFINCTQCGPRFTIVTNIPYDRPFTTMAPFRMCPECEREYHDPASRRFHAQPNACPQCGPQVWLAFSPHEGKDDLASSTCRGDSATQEARRLLKQGKILAIKGIGGFHLACDPTQEEAVTELRRRKGRVDKPFALMALSLNHIRRFCVVGAEEERLLLSRPRPVVLLKKLTAPSEYLSPWVAPGQTTLGFMLSYSPLHELLLQPDEGFPPALVMTSGNLSEEPIATSNEEALARLGTLADAFLLHDREIHVRCDDSVVRIFAKKDLPIRRSRGYTPYPVKLPFKAPSVLATGGELKNTFCVTREDYAFLSQHVGDMENYETLKSFEHSVSQFERLFRIKPVVLAHDLHPNYLAVRYALARAEQECLPTVAVQHHHAHIAACLAENGHTGQRPVIGVALDGTGYGNDGAIWGGEFLIADYDGFERAAHLAYLPLPGGDLAARKPYRVALSYLRQAGIDWTPNLPCVAAASETELAVIANQIRTGINTPQTSSMGRLFDAVASLLDVRQVVNYEGQAAIELESLADPGVKEAYPVSAGGESSLPTHLIIEAVYSDLLQRVSPALISARFHNTLAAWILEVAERLRQQGGFSEVALSGGVFQNVTLLGRTLDLLQQAGFVVYTHHRVPPNDGGIALGQAVVAAQSVSSSGN